MTQEYKADYSKWIEYLDQLGYRKVVTCKECKHRHLENKVWTCPFGLPQSPDFWCALGEREADNGRIQ